MKEFDLLSRIYQATSERSGVGGERVVIGPGDDMALLRMGTETGESNLLVAVDQVIDGHHFQLDRTPIELIGRKAMTRSLSDIAAMAGRPLASLAAVFLPNDFGEERAMALFDAMRETAEEFGCPLVGGDISIGRDRLSCSVTVLAEVGPSGFVVTRSGAEVGDAIYVTGRLGGSLDSKTGLGRHLTFEPRIDLALALVDQVAVHAMIDLSDGLGRDLTHIAEMSKLSAEIDQVVIPCTPGCTWKEAIADGEDYELCFTVDSAVRVPDRLLDVPITRIGEMKEMTDRPRTVVRLDSSECDVSELGWEHGA